MFNKSALPFILWRSSTNQDDDQDDRLLEILTPEYRSKIQRYQLRAAKKILGDTDRLFVYHGMGSGKTTTAVLALEHDDKPYVYVTRPALRAVTQQRLQQMLNKPPKAIVVSPHDLSSGKYPLPEHYNMVIDEVHTLSDIDKHFTKPVLNVARKANKLILLSGTPVTNNPEDFATTYSLLTGKEISKKEFRQKYLQKPSWWSRLINWLSGTDLPNDTLLPTKDLQKSLQNKVDYHENAPKVPVEYHNVITPMSVDQRNIYRDIQNRMPKHIQQLLNYTDVDVDNLKRWKSFLIGMRAASISPAVYYSQTGLDIAADISRLDELIQHTPGPYTPYTDYLSGLVKHCQNQDLEKCIENHFQTGVGDPDFLFALKSFQFSGKLQKAFQDLNKHLQQHPAAKAMVYSSFIGYGLMPYMAAITYYGLHHPAETVPLITSGMSDDDINRRVEEFNSGKSRIILISPAAMEGLTFRGVQLVQVLDPPWNPAKYDQMIARTLRPHAHEGLPDELRKVTVYNYISYDNPRPFSTLRSWLGLENNFSVDEYIYKVIERKRRSSQPLLHLLQSLGKREPENYRPGLLKAAESAVGIPDRDVFGDPLKDIKEDRWYDLVVQKHKARRAGQHYDVRLGDPKIGLLSWAVRKGLPKPGEKHLAIQQPVHTYDYGSFQGEISEGYGAGKVTLEKKTPVLVTRVTDKSIQFTVGEGRFPERFVLLKLDNAKDPNKQWLIINVTPTSPIPYLKRRYASVPPDEAEKILSQLQPGSSVQAKIDGAASLTKLYEDRAEVLSYRIAKDTGYPIIHTERLKSTQRLRIPKEYIGSILRGEIFGVKDEKAISPQELGGLLNASVYRSHQQQKDRGIQLKNLLFDIVQLKNKSVDPEKVPYSERYRILQDIIKYLPKDKFVLPENITDVKEAIKLWKQISSGKHPLTSEGIIVHPEKGTPIKIKTYQEYDVYIRGFFPGEGKYKNVVGGFYYSLEPNGTVVGKVGTGFDDDTRLDMKQNPDKYIGRKARVKAQEQFPSGALRAPVFIALHEDEPQPSVLDMLIRAKQESDRRNYSAKHRILRTLLQNRPHEFVVDSSLDGIIGITHKPTNFKIHIPRNVIPEEFQPEVREFDRSHGHH